VRAAVRRAATLAATGRRAWRRSLQIRVVTITLLAASVLVGAFGYLVVKLTTDSSLDRAFTAAEQRIKEDAVYARDQLSSHVRPGDRRLGETMRRVVMEFSGQARPGARSEADRLVALVPPLHASAEVATTGDLPVADIISEELEATVAEGQVAYQIDTANLDGEPVKYLVYGVPVTPGWGDGPPFQLYQLTPLTAEAESARDVRNTVLATGTALVLLLAFLTGLVTRLVVRPVRVASRTAQRLSAGLLDQRMVVAGDDDLALLAASFNEMAANLQRQIVRLEEMSRQQRRFTSDVSHELRTPLTTVRMAADLLFSERDSYPPETARSAELLQHELDRFESLLTDLLEISRFDAGFATLDAEPVELGPIVRRALDRLASLSSGTGTQVEVRLPDHPVIAEVDPRRVERILRNLVGNAVEHGECRPVVVTLASDEDAAAISVRDQGVGLRPGEEQLVFSRFWRADPSRTRRTGGTGLGLSISMEDAKLHGGWLEAWGEPGSGSQFRLTLPLHAGEQVRSSPLPLVPSDVDGGVEHPPTAGDGATGPDRPSMPEASAGTPASSVPVTGSVPAARAAGSAPAVPGPAGAARRANGATPATTATGLDPELTGPGAAS
jgi:two-component system sensor histidine kinase MtrB